MSAVVAGTGTSAVGPAYVPKSKPVYKPLSIDWDKFPEYAGLKLTDVITCTWRKDNTAPTWDLEAVIANGVDLRKSNWRSDKKEAPLSLTFKTAVQLVIDFISQTSSREEGRVFLEYSPHEDRSILHKIMFDLSCATNEVSPKFNPNLIQSKMPSFKFGSCEADHVNCILGSIIQMLYEAELIEAYGYKQGGYWVQLKQVKEEGKL